MSSAPVALSSSSESKAENKQRSSSSSSSSPRSLLYEGIVLVLCASSIYVCFLGYGFIQESIYSRRYGPEGEKFRFSLFLVFMQCIGNAAFAAFTMLFQQQPKNAVPIDQYIKISFSYVFAMYGSNLALSYMSYPAQALAKSVKLIPVMLTGVLLYRKRYSVREYLQVAFITTGIVVFMVAKEGGGKGGSGKEKETTLLGFALCIISLLLDGYTSPTQEKMNEKFKPSMSQMQFWLNFYAIFMVGILLLITGEFFGAVDFVIAYPSIIYESLLFGLLSALGQAAILYTLLRFNSLVVVTITTTRKFFTILASVAWYGHQLSGAQWGGVALVFAGLGFDIYHKYTETKNKRKLLHKTH